MLLLIKLRAGLDTLPFLYTLESGNRTFVRDFLSLIYAVNHRLLLFATTCRFSPPVSRQPSDAELLVQAHQSAVELCTIPPEIQSSI